MYNISNQLKKHFSDFNKYKFPILEGDCFENLVKLNNAEEKYNECLEAVKLFNNEQDFLKYISDLQKLEKKAHSFRRGMNFPFIVTNSY